MLAVWYSHIRRQSHGDAFLPLFPDRGPRQLHLIQYILQHRQGTSLAVHSRHRRDRISKPPDRLQGEAYERQVLLDCLQILLFLVTDVPTLRKQHLLLQTLTRLHLLHETMVQHVKMSPVLVDKQQSP